MRVKSDDARRADLRYRLSKRPARKEGVARGLQPGRTPTFVDEWDRTSPESPAYARGYGSPTVLVDGRDLVGAVPGDGGSSCRLYHRGFGGFDGAPSAEQVAQVLRVSSAEPSASARSSSGWRSSLATLPGVAVAVLPKLACPACWPAYAGLLSSVGLGFLITTTYLFPLTAAFLILAVGALAFRAQTRREFGPCAAGLVGATLVLVGKFAFDSNVVMYSGIGLLVAASVWNAWPKSNSNAGPLTAMRSARAGRERTNVR